MADIRIDSDELYTSRVDEIVNLEAALTRSQGEFIEDVKTPFYLNPIFYYTVACSLAALGAWAMLEPFISESEESIPFISDYLLFGGTAGMIGLALGAVFGLANRNLSQVFICGGGGLALGLLISIATTAVAWALFNIFLRIAVGVAGEGTVQRRIMSGQFPFAGLSFVVFMCGRGIAWSVVSVGAGLGLGILLKSRKLALNGVAGGMVGGLLGGLLFDPISRWLTSPEAEGDICRAVGLLCVGLLVGFFIGLFENVSKDSWLLMLKGPLTGKQFIVFKSPLVLGSAPKCDVYLFKDPDIDPRHATIRKTGSRYLLEDQDSRTGVLVNGKQVDRCVLQPGDVITLGETVLRYHERRKD